MLLDLTDDGVDVTGVTSTDFGVGRCVTRIKSTDDDGGVGVAKRYPTDDGVGATTAT